MNHGDRVAVVDQPARTPVQVAILGHVIAPDATEPGKLCNVTIDQKPVPGCWEVDVQQVPEKYDPFDAATPLSFPRTRVKVSLTGEFYTRPGDAEMFSMAPSGNAPDLFSGATNTAAELDDALARIQAQRRRAETRVHSEGIASLLRLTEAALEDAIGAMQKRKASL